MENLSFNCEFAKNLSTFGKAWRIPNCTSSSSPKYDTLTPFSWVWRAPSQKKAWKPYKVNYVSSTLHSLADHFFRFQEEHNWQNWGDLLLLESFSLNNVDMVLQATDSKITEPHSPKDEWFCTDDINFQLVLN